MALSDIVQKILDDANLKAKQISSKSEALMKEINIENESKIEKMIEEKEVEVQKKEKAMISKTNNLILGERRNLLLKKKREILADVFEKAKKVLSQTSDKDLEEIITGAFSTISEEEGIIYPAKGSKSLIENVMKKAGKSYKIGNEKDFLGGFIFVSNDSEIDLTFEAIIDKIIKPKLELDIAQLLFNKN